SKPQGAFSQYLERVRVSTTYEEFKRFSERIVRNLPAGIGSSIEHAWDAFCAGLKGAMFHGQLFEALGIKYMGPIDGHDLRGLINFLAEIKHVERPVLLHVKTVKGQGYEIAAQEPTRLHSPAPFTVNGCRVEISPSGGRSWTSAFADAMIALARENPRVIALTAAMPDGTGLSKFEKAFENARPPRYFDTGICESHLVGMAAGMAKAGLRPVAAIYSTFIQRAFDQIWQEVVLNGLPVVFAMDRAGFVGDDGAVHHGFMDQAFLRPLPQMVLMAPSDEGDLNRMLRLALELDVPSALRYPRDNVPPRDYEPHPLLLGRSRTLRHGADLTLLAYGALVQNALLAAEMLAREGIEATVVDARFCKPLDGQMLAAELSSGRPVLTIEDHHVINGFGAAVLEHANFHHLPTDRLTILGMPDRLIPHMTRAQQLAEAGLDAPSIATAAKSALLRTQGHVSPRRMAAVTEPK
ncbi:MAG: 1-deoxy-D-xylulose-5-phosphate synthase, partial [Phycisphaerae bacterium]|nr:1-deoxy-D-xylulose-5-phosphate synthase [Phycisphaerae bacterium]